MKYYHRYFDFQDVYKMGAVRAHQYGYGRCIQTGTCIEDGIPHDRYSSVSKYQFI